MAAPPWCSLACSYITQISAPGCVQISPLLLRPSIPLNSGHTKNFILTGSQPQRPHVQTRSRSQAPGLGLQHIDLRDTIQPITKLNDKASRYIVFARVLVALGAIAGTFCSYMSTSASLLKSVFSPNLTNVFYCFCCTSCFTPGFIYLYLYLLFL